MINTVIYLLLMLIAYVKKRNIAEDDQIAVGNSSTHPLPNNDDDERMSRHAQLEEYRRYMLTQGWCCHQVNHLFRMCDLQTLRYLSQMPLQRQANHQSCRAFPSCIAYNVDNNMYQTRHVKPDCTCEFIEAPRHRMIQILKRGGVPLMEIVKRTESEYELRVHERKRQRYVAISHVWADGLGNPRRCALPTCQLVELQSIVQRLPKIADQKKKLFWMDTLCIPVEQEHEKLRLMQIDAMVSIYHFAKYSLVLDRELMETDPRPTSKPITLAYARTLCSVWNQRIWTYQEAVVPPALVIRFKGFVAELHEYAMYEFPDDPESTHEPGVRPNSAVEEIQLSPETHSIPLESPRAGNERRADEFENIPSAESTEADDLLEAALQARWQYRDNHDFATVWNELGGRSTTKSSDLPLVLSNCMNLQNKDLLRYDEPEQMFQAMLLSQMVPLSLFSNTGPRCQWPGDVLNRWVPTRIHDEPLTSKKMLKVTQPSWLVPWRSHHLALSYDGQNDDSISVYILSADKLGFPCRYLQTLQATFTIEPSNFHIATDGPQQTCVIIEKEYDHSSWPTVQRGSCYTVVRSRASRWPRQRSTFVLVFRGPLRLTRTSPEEPPPGPETLSLDRISSACNLEILYDKLPGVKPLKPKPEFRRDKNHRIFSWVGFCVLLAGIGAVAVFMDAGPIEWDKMPLSPDSRRTVQILIGFLLVVVSWVVIYILVIHPFFKLEENIRGRIAARGWLKVNRKPKQ